MSSISMALVFPSKATHLWLQQSLDLYTGVLFAGFRWGVRGQEDEGYRVYTVMPSIIHHLIMTAFLSYCCSRGGVFFPVLLNHVG